MAAAVDGQDVQAVAEAVERQGARQRDHHAAIDDAGAQPALALGVVVEMDPGAIVVEARGAAVLALHHAHAVDMVDALADDVVLEEVGLAGLARVDPADAQARGHHQPVGRHVGRQLGHHGLGCRRGGVALADHDPAHIVDDRRAVVLPALAAHPDDAGLAAGGLLEADHLRAGVDRVAGVDQPEEAPVGVAEIGHGVERDVGHGLAEDQVEGQQVLDRRSRQAVRPCERIRAVLQEPGAGQRQVEGGVADVHGARRRVPDLLADVEVLEEVAGGGLAHVIPDRRRCCIAAGLVAGARPAKATDWRAAA